MRNRKSGWRRATDGRGLGAGELPAGFTTSEGQQGQSGDRRHESVGVAGLPEAALASHSGATVNWDLSTATGEASGDREAGRRGAQAGHSDGAGPVCPAGGDAGPATQMGPDVFRAQSRVSSATLSASGGGQGAAVYCRGQPLGGGSGSGKVFRSSEPRQADGSDSAAGERQEDAQVDPSHSGVGRDGERAGECGGRRNSARRSLHAPYTKGNFQFERTVTGWRARYPVLDLRLKR